MDPSVPSNRNHAARNMHASKKMRLDTADHKQPNSTAKPSPPSKKTGPLPRKSRGVQSPLNGDQTAAPLIGGKKLPRSPPRPADPTPTGAETRRYPVRSSRTKVASYSILNPDAEHEPDNASRPKSLASDEHKRLGQFYTPGPDDDFAWNSDAEESVSEVSDADECSSSDTGAEEVDAEDGDSEEDSIISCSGAPDSDSEMEESKDLPKDTNSTIASRDLETQTLELRDDLAGDEAQLEQAVQSVFGTESAAEGIEPNLGSASIVYSGGRKLAKFLSEINEIKWDVPTPGLPKSTSQPFSTPHALKDHFSRVHKGLDPSMLNDRLPPKHDPKRWVPIQCPWRHECEKGGAIFNKFTQLATHAQHRHGLGRLEVERKVIEILDSRS
ncbi:hypothetical protein K4K58_009155 [Colletotrichum sp. SAR11_239]|nr:hypothetical protein K4K58_009155 [Colletotrichum sp. SAR11_239]